MDIDWEYPVGRLDSVAAQEDKQNFVLLLSEVKRVLSPAGLLLTVAVGATSARGEISYDIPGVAANVDFINLMTYDLHGSWDSRTGINAPLYAGSDSDQQSNADACVKYWLSHGCPKEKLVLGIPTYGRTFALQAPSQNGINSPVSGAGDAGPFTRQAGFLGYNEILLNNWNSKWQDDQKVPYAFNGNQWVGYDDKNSVTEKVNYAMSNDLAGCMFWSIETDDFRNGNPLISTAFNLLKSPRKFLSFRDGNASTMVKVEIDQDSCKFNRVDKLHRSVLAIVKHESNFFSFLYTALVFIMIMIVLKFC